MTKARDSAAGRLSAVSMNGGPLSGFRNKFINGQLLINQTGVVQVSNAAGLYLADQWLGTASVAGITTFTSLAGSNNPSLTGASNIYCQNSSVTKPSLAAGDMLAFYTYIEGYNVSELLWGTANAKSITISFRAQCSQATTIAVSARNNGATRSYVALVSLAAGAGTYSVTIPGDTGGSWAQTIAYGMIVTFAGALGSTFITTANTWATGNFIGATGMSNICDTASRYFELTDLQMEVGDKATTFETRPFPLELLLCQRYYWKSYEQTVAPGTAGVSAGSLGRLPDVTTNYTSFGRTGFPVAMRVTPSVTAYNPITGATGTARNTDLNTDIPITIYDTCHTSACAFVANTAVATSQILRLHLTANARM